MLSDKDGNFPGDTDGNFLLEGGKSTRPVSGDRVGKNKSDTDGKRFTPYFVWSMRLCFFGQRMVFQVTPLGITGTYRWEMPGFAYVIFPRLCTLMN